MIFTVKKSHDKTLIIVDSKGKTYGKIEHKNNLSARRNDKAIVTEGSFVGGTSNIRDNSLVDENSVIFDTIVSGSDISNVLAEERTWPGKRVFQTSVIKNSLFKKNFFVFDSNIDLCNCFGDVQIHQSTIRKVEFQTNVEIRNSHICPEDVFGMLVIDGNDGDEKLTLCDAKITNSRDIYTPEKGVVIYKTNAERFALASSSHPEENKIACDQVFIFGFNSIDTLIPDLLFKEIPESLREQLHNTDNLARNLIMFLNKEGIKEVSFDFAQALQCYGLKRAIVSGFDFKNIIKVDIKNRHGELVPNFFFDGDWLRDAISVPFSDSDKNFKI